MEVDNFSLTTVPLELFYNKTPLGHASSFVWKHRDEKLYLITNWHVVSGRNAITRKNLKTHGGRPNRLHGYFNFHIGTFGKVEVDINIRDPSDAPLWFIHPTEGAAIDVVAIPLPYSGKEADIAVYPINPLSAQSLVIRIGMEVFILGYPFGPEPPGFPVWKRGSIASEPDLVRSGPQHLLVDTASLPGMSGSPVVRRSWSNHLHHPQFVLDNNRPATKLIGVYSGRRLGNHRIDTQLGMVWPESYVTDIIDGQRLDDDQLY